MSRAPSSALPAAVLGVAILTAGLLAGCGEQPDASAGRGERPEAGSRYVALGDSYVSGPELGETVGPPGCFRTTGNYPHLLAERLDLDLVDASCGGATTENLEDEQEVGEDENPPQLDAVTEDAELVTLGIGANDDGVFRHSIASCAMVASRDPGGSPCTVEAAQRPGEAEEHIRELRSTLVDTVGEILDRAPRARVLLVGYPQLLPATGWCEQVPLARGDYAFVSRVMGLLNDALRTAAAESEAEYVDLTALTEDHDICSDDPWIAGLEPTKPAHAFHPYADEARAVADLLADVVRRSPRR